MVRADLEGLEHLVQHGTVLRRYDYPGLEAGRLAFQPPHEWTKLDGFRPGAENEQHAPHRSVEQCRPAPDFLNDLPNLTGVGRVRMTL